MTERGETVLIIHTRGWFSNHWMDIILWELIFRERLE